MFQLLSCFSLPYQVRLSLLFLSSTGGGEGRCCLREWEGMEGWFGTVVQLPPSTGAVEEEKWYARNNYLSNDEVTSM